MEQSQKVLFCCVPQSWDQLNWCMALHVVQHRNEVNHGKFEVVQLGIPTCHIRGNKLIFPMRSAWPRLFSSASRKRHQTQLVSCGFIYICPKHAVCCPPLYLPGGRRKSWGVGLTRSPVRHLLGLCGSLSFRFSPVKLWDLSWRSVHVGQPWQVLNLRNASSCHCNHQTTENDSGQRGNIPWLPAVGIASTG